MAATLTHRRAARQAPHSGIGVAGRRGVFGVQPRRFRVYADPMRSLTYIDGIWHEGNPPLLGSMSHATWQSSIVFDGARAFEGVTPDLDNHCVRRAISASRRC
jgi:hypothetical protein